MDLHIAPGVTAQQVAEAHLMDVKIQDNYFCKAITYWMDEDKGCVFCLIEAPDKESVMEMHEKAHGLIPNEIIQVNTDVVKAFLGRIQDPESAARQADTGLKVFSDPALRIILTTRTLDARILRHELGPTRMQELFLLYSTIVREQCRHYSGREVYSRHDGFVHSFTSPANALDCAVTIRKKLELVSEQAGLRISMHAGFPVDSSNVIFGKAVTFGQFLCNCGQNGQVIISGAVRDLFQESDRNALALQGTTKWFTIAEDAFLNSLLNTLIAHWHDPEFDVISFCRLMSMSKSQLYRKCMATTGMSPNGLLREFRLLQALELLRKDAQNVSQTTFDAGFSSPSYFTKCFQKRFGLQPMVYLKNRS